MGMKNLQVYNKYEYMEKWFQEEARNSLGVWTEDNKDTPTSDGRQCFGLQLVYTRIAIMSHNMPSTVTHALLFLKDPQIINVFLSPKTKNHY